MAPSVQPSRTATTVSTPNDVYEAVVVGAGPAGITAVGNLLDARIDRILWVDGAFDGGRVNKYYREVPSNTKVKLFVDFATAVSPFRKIVSNVPSRDRWAEPSASDGVPVDGKEDKLQDMRLLDQETGCFLAHPADMCVMLTQGLKKTPGVITQRGRVSEAVLDEQSSLWTINVATESNTPQDITTAKTKRILLCTGSSPTDPPLPYEPDNLKHLHLDTALSPTKLESLLSPLGPTTIAVIGASHSAVLVLRNLSDLALSSKSNLHVKWFTRHPLRYAEYEDGFIARDNTGLKGEAAVWAKENLEPESLSSSPVSKVLTKISYEKGHEKEIYESHLPGVDFVVQAIGYNRDPLPTLIVSTTNGTTKEITPYFDHDKGIFNYVRESDCGTIGDLARLPGVYGAGIAFPERVVDRKYGHEEFNVGFFKFMKAAKKWVEEWKKVPSVGQS
ncbi:hypothetical protein M409DRAFT_57839 [Zasmidium cellare ATCC 36951]|uniref:FAD/NAD(P)-binding domain-containing protein n=1 Tax=Zasmidium cellare ATCC 36951 TaxID=1080233 RepID=A0A6A6C828_ZASCE|nr:uncharacterized protein M409DRAFT_57839 [Zasmidium cellare ATCC 36951]KAF2163181.1 hypothetical protein M409DRAFT_57839 [Zasmidium cellare ATCC 36951]